MGCTTKQTIMARSDISPRVITITIFQGLANRPPSVAIARLYAKRTTDWLARKRFINMDGRI